MKSQVDSDPATNEWRARRRYASQLGMSKSFSQGSQVSLVEVDIVTSDKQSLLACSLLVVSSSMGGMQGILMDKLSASMALSIWLE